MSTKARSSVGYERRKAASHERIMAATMAEIVAHGAVGMSLSDIAAAAGVSRTTLYAHFSTKVEILDALNVYIRVGFERELRQEVDGLIDPRERLVATLAFMRRFHERWVGDRLVDLREDALVSGIRANFGSYCSLLMDVLAITFDALDLAMAASVDRRLLVEALIRIQLSAAIVRLGDEWEALPDDVEAAWDLLMALSPRRARKWA
jgi:AcrR family transcriptional regulator